MSLWTPDGEHEVPRNQPEPTPPSAEPAPDAGAGAAMPGMPSMEDLSPEERAQVEAMAQEMAEVREQLARTPAADVIANHVMGLYELGAIHLSAQPPKLGEARLAIDAMGALVDGLTGRLGQAEPTLVEALNQIRMAFVTISDEVDGAGAGAAADGDAGEAESDSGDDDESETSDD